MSRPALIPPPAETHISIDWLTLPPKAFSRTPKKTSAIASATTCCASPDRSPCFDLAVAEASFFEAARDAGLSASGIDQSAECVTLCRAKGLHAEKADLFSYLDALADSIARRDLRARKWSSISTRIASPI